ncbi:MAG: Txe/YoeB family addiction module toxin [Defluviitaleaceae bacterium]|nr:Txe/YoeB family addiction module toxin [Defluviitaleaceae bacterium]
MLKYVTFATNAWEDYQYWKDVNDKRKIKKIDKLINETRRTPYIGTGKPEQLKHDRSHQWSRQIDEEHRFVYEIADEMLIIHQCKGHY